MRIPEILQPTHVKSYIKLYLIKLYNSPINTLLSQKKKEDKKRRNYDRKYLILFKPPNLIEDHPVVLSFFFLILIDILLPIHCTTSPRYLFQSFSSIYFIVLFLLFVPILGPQYIFRLFYFLDS